MTSLAQRFCIVFLVAGPVNSLALVSASPVSAAGFDCSKFERNDDGTWRVVQALEIRGPHGRIDFTPNETYKEGQERLGLDLAKLLNANCLKR